MTAENRACRPCTRPNTDMACGYCGHLRDGQWRLPPLPGERGAVRAGRIAGVRSYALAPAEDEMAAQATPTTPTTPTAETGQT
ncbi:hypothetical protein [Streptomonospora sediminis]